MSSEFLCYRFALTNTLSFIDGETPNGGLHFSDTINYWKCSLEDLGRAIGVPKMPMPDQDEPDAVWERYCANDVDVTAVAMDRLIQFSRENDLGPWGPSIAALALNAYRHKFMTPNSIMIHNNAEAMRLERGSYFGGITECNKIGRIKGPIWEVDVCSMYPAQCMESLPTNLVEPPISCSVDALGDYLHTFMGVADVTLDSHTCRYPVRSKNGTVYPHGHYRTCLADAELRSALRSGHVRQVHSVARYDCTNHLAGYMKFFADLKCSYDTPETSAFRTLTKYYLNSLYGKFGQQTEQWRRWDEEALQEVEAQAGLKPFTLAKWYDWPPELTQLEGVHCIPQFGLQLDIRNLFGFTEVKVGRADGMYSLVAVAACVTSLARQFLRHCQSVAGARHWFYSDTDSLWVDATGLERLQHAGLLGSGILGKLEVKEPVDWLHVYGPKDYETPCATKVKGIKFSKTNTPVAGMSCTEVVMGSKRLYIHRAPDGSYHQTQFPSGMRQISDALWGGVYVRHVLKELSRQQTKWRVGPAGWTEPLHYPEDAC